MEETIKLNEVLTDLELTHQKLLHKVQSYRFMFTECIAVI